MKIQVTEQDILAGKKGSCSECPIAKAIARARGDDKIRVGVNETWIPIPNSDTIPDYIELPEQVKQFIDAFDHRKLGEPMPLPFEFDIEFGKS